MTTKRTNTEAGVPYEVGPTLQWPASASDIGLAAVAGAGATINSNVIPSYGWQKGGVGMLSDQAVTLTVQRYLDAAGQIPVGAAITGNLSANVAGSVSWSDGIPYGSFQVSVHNAGGTPANLSKVLALVQSG